MPEILIGLVLLGVLLFFVYYVHKDGFRLSDKDKLMHSLSTVEEFSSNEGAMVMKRTSLEPVAYSGFALDDTAKKMLCYNGKPGLLCDYEQILEWRVLVNNKTVACLSRLSTSDLQVSEPDKTLNLEDFLRKYCDDERPEPSIESVTMKFLIRDLSYPVHAFSMKDAEQGMSELESCLNEALGWLDKFKIVMYRHKA